MPDLTERRNFQALGALGILSTHQATSVNSVAKVRGRLRISSQVSFNILFVASALATSTLLICEECIQPGILSMVLVVSFTGGSILMFGP